MRGISRSIVTSIIVIALIVVAVVFFLAWGLYAIVPATIAYVTHRLVAVSGLNPYLVRAVVIIATIPFFFALGKLVPNVFDLIFGGFKNRRLSMYQNVYGVIVVIYIGVFFLTMYFYARNDYYRERCVKTPEGLRAFADLKRDPIYGLETHPCTLAEIVTIRRQTKSIAGPTPVSVANASTYPFFDSVTGQPKVWYYKRSNGTYALFSGPGDYPGSGVPLKPMNEVTREKIIQERQAAAAQSAILEKQAAEHQQEVVAQQAKLAKQAAELRKEAARKAAIAQLINTSVYPKPGVKNIAVLVFSQNGSSVPAIESEVAADLKKRGLEPELFFFKPAFVQSGKAEELMGGDSSSVHGLGLAQHVDSVVIGTVQSKYSAHPNLDDVTSANTKIEIRCFHTKTESSCGDSTFEATGAGFDRQAALSKSYSNAAHDLDVFVRNAF